MAVTTNKNEWVNNFAKSIGEGGDNSVNPTGGSGEGGTTDKYDALETTSYKEMLSSKIQAANAKDQALKYANDSLAGAGLGNQGIAESTRAGILGNYQRAITGADETHQANLMDIETQRQEDATTKGEEDWQTTMTMLQQATSQEDLDYLKSEFYPNMTEQQKKIFDYYYSTYARDLESQDVQANAKWAERVFQTTELKEKDGMSYNTAVKTDTLLKTLWADTTTEGSDQLKNFYMTANNGDIVAIDYTAKNGSGTKYAMFYNGKLYYVDADILGGRTPKVTYKVNAPRISIN